ncbi:hypothetical protein EON63_16560 [archaeon]|nr:MAG: hypothetical protein EON63_16560 [archaeon]
MFKKFTADENISSISQVKNSVQRSILTQIQETYPLLEPVLEDLLPKKAILIGKATDNVQLVVINNEVVFFSIHGGPFFPTLKVLHKYPNMMTRMQTDKGAIRFVLGGNDEPMDFVHSSSILQKHICIYTYTTTCTFTYTYTYTCLYDKLYNTHIRHTINQPIHIISPYIYQQLSAYAHQVRTLCVLVLRHPEASYLRD